MADKEERIFIFTTIKYTIKETNKDGVIVEGSIEPREAAKMYTRQEAIEIMAQAICMSNADGCGRRCLQGNCCYYVEREKEAKAALNALLKGGNK